MNSEELIKMQNEQYIRNKMAEIEMERIKESVMEQSEKVDASSESMLTIMEAMADQYEERQEVTLTQMEVQATIYEELLSMQWKE
jgi:hypothetical protein